MLSFCEPPRTDEEKIPFLRRVKPDEKFHCAIAAKEPLWIFVHWRGAVLKTRVCRAKRERSGRVIDPSACDGCKSESPERLQGYLWVYNYGNHKWEWLEITKFCWDCVTTQGSRDTDLLGCELKLTRGRGAKTRFFVDLSEPRASWAHLKQAKPPSPEESLLKVMG